MASNLSRIDEGGNSNDTEKYDETPSSEKLGAAETQAGKDRLMSITSEPVLWSLYIGL